ncbi:AAC(3) family N-acetyltransferase [Geobacter sulfurreducens]|uniref:AAC(3) family N-acetyltransferase n=1 Tax=Geobacter sulfurreducens TaxID=35554 RepID=UPI001BDCF4AD|nr:AAC(3) family N-acetyltransferase [Geobacter sulfurreducens]QVW33908.1 AAC(3) family N-acetyltransferase [Geobacter sulfurreducens]
MKSLAELKRQMFPKGIRRELQNLSNRIFRRTTEKKLARAFAQLNIPPGALVCVHSMLSGLGYIVGGPETVIKAIQRAIPGCTIMMPSFPFSGSAKDYVDSGAIYDRDNTPSQSGLLTECLRKMPGAVRSLHPTHPCVALGPRAHELIDGSENSPTPFGDDSTYGRFSADENAYLLLIHTNNTSIVHRIQEMVDMPNLFLEGMYEARALDGSGQIKSYRVKLHTPVLPLYVIEHGNDGRSEYIWFPDYVLLFPKYNCERIETNINASSVWQKLMKRHENFVNNGDYKTSKQDESEIMMVKLEHWINQINSDVRESIRNYSDEYVYDALHEKYRNGNISR